MYEKGNRMRVNGINSNYNNSFKHKIFIDIGASNPKGTMKILAQTDDGQDIYKKSGYVNTTIDGFTDNAAFVRRIAHHVRQTHKKVVDMDKKGIINLQPHDRKLSGVAIFVPGTTMVNGKKDKIAFMPNLKDKEGNSLVDVDFSKYEKDMKTLSYDELGGVDVNRSKFEFMATKDLGGAGLSIAKILSSRGELKEGDYIMGIMTGGGFGSVDIKVKDRKVEIETSESSSYLTASPHGGKLEKLGRLGVSVKSHINHYCDSLGLPELAEGSVLRKALLNAGDARIVADNEIHLKNQTDGDLIETFVDSPLFRIKEADNKSTVIEMVDDDPNFAKKMQEAKISSIKDYAEAISLISVNKINDCLNKIVLVGPFAQGLNRYVQEHPEEFAIPKGKEVDKSGKVHKINGLDDLIEYEVAKRIDEVDLPSSRWLSDLYNFEVICDKDINFSNNTYAGDVLLNKKLRFTRNRGSWFSVPLSELPQPENVRRRIIRKKDK